MIDASSSGRTPNSSPMRTSAANTRLIEAANDASESSAAAVKRRLLTACAERVFMSQRSIQEQSRQTKTEYAGLERSSS